MNGLILTAVLALAFLGLFALFAVGLSGAEAGTLKQLARNGRLCLGTVLSYDDEDVATVEFLPAAATSPFRAQGIGYFQKRRFPPGSQVAVW